MATNQQGARVLYNQNGAFFNTFLSGEVRGYVTQTSPGQNVSQTDFDASCSNSYYGASAVPQVPANQALMIIKA